MKLRKPTLSLGHIRIPHPDRVLHANLPHQHTIHPSKAELDKLDALVSQVFCERDVDPLNKVAESGYLALDARLGVDVVVLDAVEEFC